MLHLCTGFTSCIFSPLNLELRVVKMVFIMHPWTSLKGKFSVHLEQDRRGAGPCCVSLELFFMIQWLQQFLTFLPFCSQQQNLSRMLTPQWLDWLLFEDHVVRAQYGSVGLGAFHPANETICWFFMKSWSSSHSVSRETSVVCWWTEWK